MFTWAFINNTASVIAIGTPLVEGLWIVKNHVHQWIASSSLPHLLKKLDDELQKSEKLLGEIEGKGIVVRMVIEIREPSFIPEFTRELEMLQVRARTARRKLQDHSKETTAEEIAMQRNELHELITQCEQTYKDRVTKSESLQPEDVLRDRIWSRIQKLPIPEMELREITMQEMASIDVFEELLDPNISDDCGISISTGSQITLPETMV